MDRVSNEKKPDFDSGAYIHTSPRVCKQYSKAESFIFSGKFNCTCAMVLLEMFVVLLDTQDDLTYCIGYIMD